MNNPSVNAFLTVGCKGDYESAIKKIDITNYHNKSIESL